MPGAVTIDVGSAEGAEVGFELGREAVVKAAGLAVDVEENLRCL